MKDSCETGAATWRVWTVLAILMCFYLLSFLDKQMYALLINMIGTNLKLSDMALGTIQGSAFSGSYTLGVLATGWAVDRYSRRLILFLGVFVWSVAAACSGLSNSFETLFMARAGVGIGEAVMIPAALSLLASAFPRERLSFATGIFSAGANIGGVVALILGGSTIASLSAMGPAVWPLFGKLQPWQASFVATGLPGAIVAFLAFGIPRRLAYSARPADGGKAPLLPFVLSHKAFLASTILSLAMLTTLAYTLIIWSPAYFERHFHWGHKAIGFAVAAGVAAGGVGNIFWGWAADRMRKRGLPDALFLLYGLLVLVGIPVAAVTLLTANATVACVGYPVTWFLLNSFGPMMSALQFGIPDELRGRLIGLMTTVTGLVGLSAGPLMVSSLTDYVFHDKAMVGTSILISLSLAGLLAALILALGRRAYVVAVKQQETRASPASDAQKDVRASTAAALSAAAVVSTAAG